jgi:flagellar basal body P-ring formation protein FlgA
MAVDHGTHRASAGGAMLLRGLGGYVALSLLVSALALAGERASVVRLYPRAVVASDQIPLSDISELQGEAASLAGHWVVASLPAGGQTLAVDLAGVQAALSGRGANLGQWIFRGSSQCLVSRVKSDDTTAATKPAHTADGSAASVPATRPAPDANTLEGCLRSHISNRVRRLGGTPVIQFSPAVARLLPLSQPTYGFEIADRTDRLLGMVTMEVTIREGKAVKQVIPVIAQVALRKSVVVSARSINRGETIGLGDLLLADQTVEQVADIGAGEPAPFLGQRAKRFIEHGERLSARDIEPLPLVNRNDLVTVLVNRGGVQIKGVAKAMTAGSYGETIMVQNESSRQKYSAVVTGPRTAEVVGSELVPSDVVAMSKEERP